MPAFSRFGASKYRNAVPAVPPRDNWYRSSLPAASTSTSTSSQISTFSSEVKTTREWIVTVSPSGELSLRGYGSHASEGVLVMRGLGGGGGVGDWDVSQLEDGALVIGGIDGSLTRYTLPTLADGPMEPKLVRRTIIAGVPITAIALHPTVPGLVLVSNYSRPMAVYNLDKASDSPAVTCWLAEAEGMWSVAWSPDGRLVAGAGRTGKVYVFDPRQSKELAKYSSSQIQATRPMRLAWVGENLLITSFTKSRGRQWSLHSLPTLEPAQQQTIDSNTSPLLAVVDQDRSLVYMAGRGIQTIRQIEFSGPQGYQESLHSAPHPLASASLALVHPSTLPVMQAQIGALLLPVIDKDGDALLPLGIKVPRKTLLDFHEDIFPEITGGDSTVKAMQWLKGEDQILPRLSLDPGRRKTWEEPLMARTRLAKPARKPHSAELEAKARAAAKSAKASKANAAESQFLPVGDTPDSPSSSASNLPSLSKDETHASTAYKVRIMGDHIISQLAEHRVSGSGRPLMVGLQGPQGCGKTTICETLTEYLANSSEQLKSAVLSLDDLYRTHQGLEDLAKQHQDNALLSGRGPPGTHDLKLATTILAAVEEINTSSGAGVDLPTFDKSLCGGAGDRSPETIKVQGPLDVFILEGWSMGFLPLSATDLKSRHADAEMFMPQPYFAHQPVSSLITLNEYLAEFSSAIYPYFDSLIQIEPQSYDYVFQWRLQQEHAMKEKNGGKGMSDDQVKAFVERYMPGYELWMDKIFGSGQKWDGKGLRLWLGQEREVIKVERPTSSTGEHKAAVSASTADEDISKAPSTGLKSTTEIKVQAQLSSTPSVISAPPQPATVASATPSKLFNPSYSRKFLHGKSPLNPTYDQLPSLSSLHPASLVLKVTPHLALFPIQGTGGRLCVQPLKKKGRLAVGGEGYLTGGSEIADFDVETFVDDKESSLVAIASEDGYIRVWDVGKEGVESQGAEAGWTFKGKGVDKVAQVAWHPTAKSLLSVLTNDAGHTSLRLWDANLSESADAVMVQLDCAGAFGLSWSADGSKVAISTKDNSVLVLDPRQPDKVIMGKAHDSPRSFQLAWVDENHLVSVGFARGSQRRINLYTVTEAEITQDHSLLIDTSPSVLFPTYDPDTSILYVWGKGERQINAFQIVLDNKAEPIQKLPPFVTTSGQAQLGVAFFGKQQVDVKKVEVTKGLRMTARSLEEVSFTIPRNKMDFFQDDIYVPTVDTLSPTCSAAEWLAGKDTPQRRVSLQPPSMQPLSEAPQTNTPARKKFVPAANILSEEERKKQEMNDLFKRAKAGLSSSDEDEPKRKSTAPDDDWD